MESVMRLDTTTIVMTQTLHIACEKSPALSVVIQDSLHRFFQADWGDLKSHDDRISNDNAYAAWKTGASDKYDRILAIYKTPMSPDHVIWIIEEADRSVITVLLPSDY